MNRNILIHYTLLIASLLITLASVKSAQAQALSGQTPSLIVHVLGFMLGIGLIVAAIYSRSKWK